MNVALAPRPAVVTVEADDAFVTLDGVTKVFGNGKRATTALDNVSLELSKGEFVCILGTSGCGKSTLLSLDRRPGQGRPRERSRSPTVAPP